MGLTGHPLKQQCREFRRQALKWLKQQVQERVQPGEAEEFSK